MRIWQGSNNLKVQSRNWWDGGLTRGARMARVSKAATEKQRIRLVVLEMLNRDKPQLPLIVTMTRIAPRGLNDDNLTGAFKHVRDGIAESLHTTDENPQIKWVCAQERGKPREYGARVTIEEVE